MEYIESCTVEKGVGELDTVTVSEVDHMTVAGFS
jgi:hypothetical protein